MEDTAKKLNHKIKVVSQLHLPGGHYHQGIPGITKIGEIFPKGAHNPPFKNYSEPRLIPGNIHPRKYYPLG